MKLILFIVLTFFATDSFADSKRAVETVNVRNNIYMLVSPQGGNVVVSIGKDGTFIIDDQLVGRSDIIKEEIKRITENDVKFILNTHYHFDHTGGNESFGKDGAIIVAHDNVRERLSTEQFITYFDRQMDPLTKEGLPVVTFSDNMTLHYNENEIRIIHVANAHTDGDAIAHFTRENVLVAGDVIFNEMYPFVDTEHGGSIKGVIAALDKFLNLANAETIIVPGHGNLMNKAELQEYRNALNTISNTVEAAIKSGKTLEQVTEEKPTREFDMKMGGGFIKSNSFVKIVYEDLQR